MEINRQEICSSILNFLDLLENEKSDVPIEMESLELALDKLALIYHYIGEVSVDENEYPESPISDYHKLQNTIGKRFPNLGYYNLPGTISIYVGKSEMHTGDALDDLVDIANELSECMWRWQNNSENDALWHFRFGYEKHWGTHLRSLQMYLHALRSEM
jgi:hypothetical protein